MNPQNKHIKLRTVFMGTPDFARNILDALIKSEYNIVGVYTKPDTIQGRKKEITESPVKILCKEHNIDFYQPEKFNDESISQIKKLKPDLIIVAAYGKLIPKTILDIPGFGCINVHPSLLPKFRGPSPIQNALLLGEKETGTTIMLMDEGMDTGDIISQISLPIENNDNHITLSEKLSLLSINLLLNTIGPWVDRKIELRKQDNDKATLCQLIERTDGRVIWENDAQDIYNMFRAFYPWPGIFTFFKHKNVIIRIKLSKIKLLKNDPEVKHLVGEVFELGESIGVQTINGVILLEEIQPEGKKAMIAKDFLNGYPELIGSMLI